MIYTHKSPALLIIGLLILLWGGLNHLGMVDDLQSTLQQSAFKDHVAVKEKFDAELRVATEMAAAQKKPAPVVSMPNSKFDKEKLFQEQLCLIFGGVFTLIGLFILFWSPKPG
ncbi:MAG: hypothetical protein HQL95_13315, partial [Magnetococcales bacterium]|nr:hypothetical protein [Magnetococcales bacterium]